MVPPINKNESPKSALPEEHPLQGYVQKLLGEEMPPPKWDLICLICSGRFYKGNKFKIQLLRISFPKIKVVSKPRGISKNQDDSQVDLPTIETFLN